MARIRTVKPEYWSSPDTARVTDPWARLLYIAMWNWADDAGRGTANPKELCGFAFPNDDEIESAHVRRMLGALRDAYGVVLYQVGGRPYFAIPSWDLHQKIDKRRDGRHPAPEEGEPWDPDPSEQAKPSESAHSRRDAPNPRRTVGAQSAPEQGNRGTGEQGNSAPAERARPVAPRSTQPALIEEPPSDDEHVVGTWEPDDDSGGRRAELSVVPSEPGYLTLPTGPRTKSQRINDLATVYYEAVKKRTRFEAARGVLAKFVDDEWSDETIRLAVIRLVTAKRELTANALRAELNGPPKRRGQRTASERAAATLNVG